MFPFIQKCVRLKEEFQEFSDYYALDKGRPLTVTERLERCIYLEKDVRITAKFAAGRKIV